MSEKDSNTKNPAIAVDAVLAPVLLECYWCYKKFNKSTMLTVHSAEFMGGSFPICKKCNDEYDLA